MTQRFKRICFCSLAFILLIASPLATRSFAASQDDTNQLKTESGVRPRHRSPGRQVASTRGNKHEQQTIIFVGAKKGGKGAATKSNPIRAKKSNGTLNPQPIPPGKQQPE